MQGWGALLLPGVLDCLALGGPVTDTTRYREVHYLMMIVSGIWIVFRALNYFTSFG